ncbi:MAG: hypothetical protein M1830_006071, partial [Pleopsidium flavum]
MDSTAAAPFLYPAASEAALKNQYVGRKLSDIPTPAAVIDRAVARKNCDQMLKATRTLGVGFRPHVKTHKLLYGLPLPPSQAQRLGHLGKQLGVGSIGVLIDHPQQLQALKTLRLVAGFPAHIFIKIDTGYHRAGVDINASLLKDIVATISTDSEPSGNGVLKGFYSHAGHSYGGDSEEAALELLTKEIERSKTAATDSIGNRFGGRQFILSVGATPTATSVQNLFERNLTSAENPNLQEQLQSLEQMITQVKRTHTIELHAGVYTLLDLQQLATRARPHIEFTELGLSVLAEVASIYPDREPPEVLIAAGSLALGREPCKSYSGWGRVADWGIPAHYEGGHSGWIVNRVSQEHGILRKESPQKHSSVPDVQIGQK